MSRSLRIPAVYMRGGASKGVFFHERDLPRASAARDALLLRIVGSPDPFGRHCDGMGSETPGTGKIVLVAPSSRDDCDVDYLFGAVSIERPRIDYGRDCSSLCAAVGPFAVNEGLVPAVDGTVRVRMWQRNLGRRIDAVFPVTDGEALESGEFQEDGVSFPSSEVRLEYLEPSAAPHALPLLPTGNVRDRLQVPGVGHVDATLVAAGDPTIFVRAEALGLSGRETPREVNRDRRLLARLEAVRERGAAAMGVADSPALATRESPPAPRIAWIARPPVSRGSIGREAGAALIDVLARMLSIGALHPGFSGGGAIALAAAAALPGSVVSEVTRTLPGVPTRIGHVSGTLTVGAEVSVRDGVWRVDKAIMSRGARRMMSGWVHVPPPPRNASTIPGEPV